MTALTGSPFQAKLLAMGLFLIQGGTETVATRQTKSYSAPCHFAGLPPTPISFLSHSDIVWTVKTKVFNSVCYAVLSNQRRLELTIR
nr:MAG: hypothetical protein [Bacteriophage sp.]